MNTNTANGLLFIVAGLTPFIVYLGLGPEGAGILNEARAEQLFAYLFFSLPIAIMMARRIAKLFYRWRIDYHCGEYVDGNGR